MKVKHLLEEINDREGEEVPSLSDLNRARHRACGVVRMARLVV